jgi:type II secretory pathway pseudopilin PulG
MMSPWTISRRSNSIAGASRGESGFTLVEIAISIFIITLLLGSILVPLATQVESRNFENTQRILDQAREALLGYAAANGYFPCPAAPDGSTNGLEATPNHAAGVGTCAASVTGANMYHGFLPAATLGFTPVDASGHAVDAFVSDQLGRNRIRYAVSSVSVNSTTNCTLTPITRPFTAANGMRSAGMYCIAAANLLYICNSGTGVTAGTNCGTATKLTDNAIVVIWSVGPNAATTGGASVDEAQNPNPAGGSADRIFVSKTRSTVAGSEFDDIVTWIGAATIFNRLIAAGQLP